MASGKSAAVTCVRILDVDILICLKAVVRHGKGNGSGRQIIAPAPDVTDFESKSSAAEHVEQIANDEVSLSRGICGFCYEPL